MPNTGHNIVLSVDGYEVSATFADDKNAAAIGQVKQILLSSFANIPQSQRGDILDFSLKQRDNSSRGKPHAP